MSGLSSLLPTAAAASAALFLSASLVLMPDRASAEDVAGEAAGAAPPLASPPVEAKPQAPECGCPEARKSTRPKFAGLPAGPLDEGDEIATLISIQHALAHAGDGQKYVWHRDNGRLAGIIHPTSSFRNGEGAVCRHIVVMLTTGLETRKVEGNACRGAGGRWALNG
jgi:hypothetical protein